MRTCLLVSLSSFFLFAFNPAKGQSDSNNPSSFEELIRSDYKLSYPSNWRVDTSHSFGTDVFVISEKTGADDLFSENVNVLIQVMPDTSYTLERFVEISEEQIKLMGINCKITISEKRVENDIRFHLFVFYHDQGKLRIRSEQRYFLKEGKAFVLTYSAEEKNEILFEKQATAIMNSFRLL